MNKVKVKGEVLEERDFRGYLLLNWNRRTMRVVKMAPKKMKPFEIPVRIDIKLHIPKGPDIVAKGDFEIPPTKVREMLLESI